MAKRGPKLKQRGLKPSWSSHPGEHLAVAIDAKGMSIREFGRLSGIQAANLSRVIGGKYRLTADVAVVLEKHTLFSAETWLTIQMNYDLFQARTKAE